MCAEEVADVLEDLFCELGISNILQSDNGRELKNNIIYPFVNLNLGNTKIVHRKSRHPESKGSA